MIEPVKVRLDRERTLVYDFGAYRVIFERTGHSVLVDGLPREQFSSVTFFLEVLRAGLLREDPTVTIEQIEASITPADAVEVLEAVSVALNSSFTKPKDGAEGPPPASP